VTVDQQAGKPEKQIVVQFLLPIVLLVCLFAFFTRFGADGGSGGFAAFSEFTGKGRRRKKGALGGTTFADVAGAGEAVTELREIRDYLADPGKYAAHGRARPKGRAAGGSARDRQDAAGARHGRRGRRAFFSLSGAEFVESLVGVGAARVRDLFRKARKMAPAIVFIDELDAAGRKRGAGVGQGNDEREQTLNQLLVELDGFGGEAGVVVMAATNRPDILDRRCCARGASTARSRSTSPMCTGASRSSSSISRGVRSTRRWTSPRSPGCARVLRCRAGQTSSTRPHS